MTVSSHEMHGKAYVFNRFANRHPYLGALILVVILLVVLLGVDPLLGLAIASIFPAHSAHLSFLQEAALGEIPLVLLVVGLISVLGRWADTGFTHWSTRQGLVVCLFPFALQVLGMPFGSLNAPLITGVTGVVLALAVGFVEEGFFRGLLLRTLLPKGIVLSVMLSSVVFACFHLTNLFSGVPWSYVALQLISTVGLGSLCAALRLRTVSIWPPILLHALHDVPGLIMLGVNPNQVFDIPSPLIFLIAGIAGSVSLLYIAYAAYLLRPRQLARLSLVYDLATTSGSDETAESRLKRLRPATMPSASGEPTRADDVSDRPTRPLAPIAMLSEVACLLPCGHKQRSLHARFCSVCGTPIASSPFVREQLTC